MRSLVFCACFCFVGQAPPETPVVSLVSGRVKEIFLKKGDKVAAGQLLIRLDNREARHAANLAEINVAHIDATYGVLRATLDETDSRLDTKFRLLQQNAIAIKKVAIPFALLRDELHLAAVIEQAKLDIAKAHLERQRLLLAEHDIRSPKAGVVQHILCNRGDRIGVHDPVVRIGPSKE